MIVSRVTAACAPTEAWRLPQRRCRREQHIRTPRQQGVTMVFLPRRQFRLRSAAFAAGLVIGAATSLAASPEEAPFLAENDAAMAKMMAEMEITPSGDVDRDFVAMMAPHHQGAIDMAQAELRYGHNEQLRRMAQEIIATQQQEIAAMRLAVGEPLPPSVASPTQPASPPAASMSQHPTSHGAMNMSHDSMTQD